MNKRLTLISMLLGLWFTLLALACNLTTPQPPTLVPRASATPLPTIGYATLSPQELPQQATPMPQSDAVLLNLMNQVQPDRLYAHVDALQRLGTRHVNSSYAIPGAGIGAARDYIVQQFQNIEAQSQGRFRLIPHQFPVSFADVNSTAENVVGYLAGRETGAGVIVIGAHYDSISTNFEDGNSYAPGANDNASGVSALIEMARIMSSNQQPPRASILFAAFSAEEIGRVGSKAFIHDYVQAYNLPVTAMLNMDIIGSQTGPDGSINDRQIRLYSEGPNDGPSSPSRQLARDINLIVFNYMPSMEVVIQDSVDRPDRYSDHMSFNEAGYAAVRFIEPLEEINRQHTERDTLDDVQPGYLSKATQVILISATSLADGPRGPRNVVLRDNGNGSRTLVWEHSPEAVSYIVALRYPGSLVYNQYFETGETSVTADIFTMSRLASVAIAGRDANGLIGPLSAEYFITN